MTKDEIIQMARQSRFFIKDNEAYSPSNQEDHELTEHLERFAKLVAEHEREACAKMCDYVYNNIVTDEHIKDMAFKIRARGQE